MKILILKPSSLGDVVQAMPVLRLIKRHFPQAEVHWWVQDSLAGLLQDDPDLAGVIRFQRNGWTTPQRWKRFLRIIRWMRAQHFDWVIDLQCLARSGTVAWLANGKLTVGLDEPREGARGFYDLAARRPTWHTHAVDWYLQVLPLLDVPITKDFTWLPPRKQAAAAIASRWPIAEHPWIGLQPGARWLNKRWPVEHFRRVIEQHTASHRGFRYVILGGPGDEPLVQTLREAAPSHVLDLTGKLSLPEMIEWLRNCRALVTNDTGPMHVAVAVGTPVIGLFGPTEPRRTGPYGQLQNVLQAQLPCIPCMSSRCSYPKPIECLRLLSPDSVVERLNRLLISTPASPRLPDA